MQCHTGIFQFGSEVGWFTYAYDIGNVMAFAFLDVEVKIGLTGCIHDEEAEGHSGDESWFGREG